MTFISQKRGKCKRFLRFRAIFHPFRPGPGRGRLWPRNGTGLACGRGNGTGSGAGPPVAAGTGPGPACGRGNGTGAGRGRRLGGFPRLTTPGNCLIVKSVRGAAGGSGARKAEVRKVLDQFSRTELLLGREGMDRLRASRVAVFGIGGVGGYAAEALVRSGIGAIDLIDDDRICLTNVNRQIIATRRTVGRYKADVMRERVLEINPEVSVQVRKTFFLPENAGEFPFDEYDYVVDAVDTVTAKLQLAMKARECGTPIISCMGAGNKLDPTAFRVADIGRTKTDPLARVMRRELKKRGIEKMKVVYSEETPTRPVEDMSISCRKNCICPPGTRRHCTDRRDIPGSTAFVPSVAGLIMAAEVVRDLTAGTGYPPGGSRQGAAAFSG